MIKKIFLLAILPSILFAQETKKVVEKQKFPKSKEVYYVLKSDKTTKHGNYKKYGYNNSLLINGYYKNGDKVDVWEFYDFWGNLEQKYDFTKKEIVFFKPLTILDNKESKTNNELDSTTHKIDRPPLYIGGTSILFEYIVKIKYPQQAYEKGISGKVYVKFKIDENGKTFDYIVTKGIGYGCDEEALKIIKAIPDNWIPALSNGKTISSVYVIPINFSLH